MITTHINGLLLFFQHACRLALPMWINHLVTCRLAGRVCARATAAHPEMERLIFASQRFGSL